MSAPTVTVVFKDADDDEFPYVVYTWPNATDDNYVARAFSLIATDMDHGDIHPTTPVRADRVVR